LARDQKDGRFDRFDRFDRIMGQRLAAGCIAGDAQCPDASLIAAYHERSIPAGERAQCERHFAQCARCASALAALARIDDAVEAGGIVSAQPAGGDNRTWWRPRGTLPLAAFGAAAAILIVVAVRTFTAQRGPIRREARSEQRSEPQAKSLAAKAAPAPAKSGFAGASGGSNSLMAKNEAVRAKSAPPPPQESFAARHPSRAGTESFAQHHLLAPLSAEPMVRERAPSSFRDELKKRNTRALEFQKQTAEVASSPAAPAAAAASPSTGMSANRLEAAPATTAPETSGPVVAAEAALGASSDAAAAPAVAGGVSTAPGAAAPIGAGTGAIVGAAVGNPSASTNMAVAPAGPLRGANAIVVESPDHTAVWMVGAHGAISRYTSASGWVPQTSGVTTDLSGGSAPSTTTCWIVGRSGTILRTVDGEHWTRVITPVGDDLTSVVASSATDATISAASGRRYATSDGGATWRPL
jgi:hypothetical protein